MFWIFKEPPADPVYKPLMDSPIPIVLILVSYLVFVLKLGKIFMRNRQPYNVKYIMLIYNIIQVGYNAYIFYKCFYWIFLKNLYNLRCMESLFQTDPRKSIERDVSYLYMLNKILDLLDTIFIVLRKNWKQITLLHVYHHAGMVSGGYLLIRTYGYGGHIAITGTLNTLVHVVMYTYYFLCALSPTLKNSLWWKKYITKFQLLQFMIIFLHTAYVMFISKNCNYPKIWLWVHLTQSIVMMFMFGNFYVKAYLKTNQKRLLSQNKFI